jgi:hypothetical protein
MGVTGGSPATINSPFTILDQTSGGAAGAYVIQTTSVSANAMWSNGQAVGIYSFYAVSNPGTLSVTTASFPEGFNGVSYSTALAAQGGVSPYTWSQTSGILPTGLSLSSGVISGTPSTGVETGLVFKVTDSTSTNASSSSLSMTIAASQLSISTTTCPAGTQLSSYAGCTMSGSGGTSPLTWSVDSSQTYATLPEGLALNASTGAITSSLIGGQGNYVSGLILTDSLGSRVEQPITFAVTGDNAFAASVFPANSIFHHRVDAATTSLPVDTSPAAAIDSAYSSDAIQVVFGTANGNFPFGIPMIEVPYNQTLVNTLTVQYQCYFGTENTGNACLSNSTVPVPPYAPIEGTANNVNLTNYIGDGHVLAYVEAGGGNPPQLIELFEGILQGDNSWDDASNAAWWNVGSTGSGVNAQVPSGAGTTDAAGLPILPLLVNADEVIGSGTPTSPSGTIQHPMRFTIPHALNYWVWPATATSGIGSCSSSGGAIPGYSQISQSSPPVSCTFSGVFGEIYRLKSSVTNPSCAATSPQASIIITALRNYGIILADNGEGVGLIGTPDARWNDTDLTCLNQITASNFEPVNVSSLIVSNDSGQTPSSSTPSVSLSGAILSGGSIQ